MTLHIFVDATKEMLVHAFHGDDKEAARFMKHRQEHNVTHIKVQSGQITVGE